MRGFFFATVFTILSLHSYSQCIYGKITDLSGDPISYATIYVADVSSGTTSNIEGDYKLELPTGKHQLTVRYLGYKTKELEVTCDGNSHELNIILEEHLYKIPEVRILASGEDPAYPIMRKAIAMSYYYLNQVEEYHCRIYLKGSGKAEEIPRLLKKTLKKEGIEEGKPIVIENITNLHFQLPDIVEENTISMRSSIETGDVSPMSYITLSLYNDIDGIISPLSRDAFTYYKFQLDASFYDQDYLVHKIRVIPRREGFDLYSGHIYIVEGFWHLHSAELLLEQKMFSIKINQVYTPVEKDVWMPISHDFDIDIKMMGIEFTFKYVASVSNYEVELNSKLDHNLYRSMLEDSREYVQEVNDVINEQQKEIQELVQKHELTKKESRKLKKLVREDVKKSLPEKDLEIKENTFVEDSAELRSVEYWDSIRPIPLTVDEMGSYKVKDSIQLRMETDSTFKDSIERKDSKLTWGKLFMGGTLSYSDGKHRFSYGGLVDFEHIDYNTVEGWKYGMEFTYSYSNDSGKYFRLNHEIDYAFGRERMTNDFGLLYRYNGLKRGYLYIDGGRKTSDFDQQTGITKGLNLITTLFLKENWLKLYQKDYFKVGHEIDIDNGLSLYTGIEYAERKKLMNHDDFYFFDPFDNEFTSNIPPSANANLIDNNFAVLVDAKIQYTPRYYYRINDGVKRYQYSNYPTFSLYYKKGIQNIAESDVNFDFLEFSIFDNTSIRKLGTLHYNITAGTFLNTSEMYFADYKHFGANAPVLISANESSDIFRLMDYYDYSTNKSYLEAHVSLTNDPILLKRLPGLNKTLMNETLYFNYLSSEGNKPYYEIGYGLNQIFLLFNVEVFAGFKGRSHEYTGIKIGIPFVGRNGDEIRIGG